jgi:hypothetical protein
MDNSPSFTTGETTAEQLKHDHSSLLDDEHYYLPIHYSYLNLLIIGFILFFLILIPNVCCVGTKRNGKEKDE